MLKKLVCLLSAALLTQAATAQTTPAPLDSLRARASRTLHARRYAEAATLLQQQAAAEPFQSSRASAFYNLACARALAGQPQPALRTLAEAQRLGFNKLALVRTDTDLTSLRATPEFAQVVRRMVQADARLGDPRQAKLVTTDITHFWRAYDLAAKDTAHAEAIYQREYFDKASVGLQDYFLLRIRSVRDFVQNQRAKPRFYQAIRPSAQRIATMAPQIRAGFRRLKELYPEARFPNVYFVIGRWNSAGTVSNAGMLIGADQLSGTPTTPVDELSAYGRRSLGTLAQLPYVVAHEHIHTMQKPSNDLSLLRGAINEGMADFLAELTTGHNPNASLLPYGLAHEKQVWADFTKELGSSNWTNWIANGKQETADKPADLGYFVGYRICQSYYQEMADKQQAVHDMLNISDYPAFLAKSRYAEKLAAR
ncbi:MAG: TPR end-of-group domain-containing protein [Janthinobacterium lividum]